MSWLARAVVSAEAAREARLTGSDAYAWHRAAWLAFPGLEQEPRGFLSRLDVMEVGYRLLLLSRQHQPQCPAWCPPEAWDVKEIGPQFLGHRHYRFDLRANPTRRVVKLGEDGQPTKNGKRKALTSLAEQDEWLQRKAASGGFRLVARPDVGALHDQVFRRRGMRGVVAGVRFQGTLEVTDADAFTTAFYQGIGSAKGFGFGMLLLQPLSASTSVRSQPRSKASETS